ncbi:WD repeat-containing protein 75 [Cephus cinctus]|uniref:WD repeat-containing protein 75 n=1 Tax=Cephus cinctus TaxID=211228 RepID=A0AAJ7BZH5_CEPCN|nr:WD repeat-containing protein 75 [Cephus cinctus]
MRSKLSYPSKGQNTSKDELNLMVKRIGGGSIIDRRPLFSHNGEILYVVWKQVIRAFSTQTGDFVREFESIEGKIAGIASCSHSLSTIIGCSDIGELIFWNCYNGLIIKRYALNITDADITVRTFHILNYKTEKDLDVKKVLVTYVVKAFNRIRIVLFDLETGIRIEHTNILKTDDNYYVDIIGNQKQNLIALAQGRKLHILNPAKKLTGTLHKTGRLLTCVAGHPEEDYVATGDFSGRVLVWKDVQQSNPIQGTYHWHTLPVTEIVFSISGGHFYTGGGECVLVKWTLTNPQHKSFLPRLPAPIKHLTIAPDNQYVAISTLDNGIIVSNPQRKLSAVIQNFTWGVAPCHTNLFPAGLTVDPRTNSLVLNSRTGHVQFYNVHTKTLLYNVNITGQNLLSQERNTVIVNTEVTKIALNHDGTWMVTAEHRDDKVSAVEVRLKFWQFDLEKQLYTLNTSIELPHDNGVNALQFQPLMSFDNENSLVVTTGQDKKFKLWTLAESSSIYKKTRHWQCHSVGLYRDFSATDAGFSMDGSLLGVGFGSSLTIWIPETNELKCSLTHSRYSAAIKRIEFGRYDACHLVVVGSAQYIAVWNLLTLSVIWSVPLKLATLCSDPNSIYMAAFTADATLYVFTPQSSQPVYTKRNVLPRGNSVLGSSFVPHLREKCDSWLKQWQRKSQLFFLDSNQELLTLESEAEANVSLDNLSLRGNISATAFSALIASKKVSDREKESPVIHEYLGIQGKGVTDELLSVSSHTLPPIRMLSAPFILSLIPHAGSNKQLENKSSENMDVPVDSGNETDDDDDDVPTVREPSPRIMNNEENDTSTSQQLINYDWSFLSMILPSKGDV